MSSSNAGVGTLGFLLIVGSLIGLVWNIANPKHYGFLITLNSGDKRLFTTIDKSGLKQVSSTIYDF